MRLLRRGERFAEFALGNATVVALSDGYGTVPTRQLLTKTPIHIAAEDDGCFPLEVNAFMVEANGRRVLIDAGSADAWHATAGRLYEALSEAGTRRESIDAVAITHCHADHIGGLVMPNGHVAFPNAAQIFVPAEETALFRDEARLAPLINRIVPFHDGDRILPGIKVVGAHGHEIGHSGFMIDGGGERLLAWGDIVHVGSVQFAHPDATWEFDADRDMARQSRLRLFEMASTENIPVAGAHLPFPGIGMVCTAGTGFAFQAIT